MPARQLILPDRQDDATAELAQLAALMTPEQLEAFALQLDGHDRMLLEQAIAQHWGEGWRSDPAAFAHHLDPTFLTPPYVELLSGKFREAVEGTNPRQIWNLPARLGKPVEVNQLVLMGDGSRRRLGDVAVGDEVVAHTGRARRVTAVHEQGRIPVLQITTHRGRVVVTAPDHPFLTTAGWRVAADLTAGDVLAVPSSPNLGGSTDRAAVEFRMLGYLLGDGNVTIGAAGGQAMNVTCFDPIERADIDACAAAMGWRVRWDDARGRVGFRAGAGQDRRTAGPRPWVRAAGIAGATSHTKRIPPWVFTAPAAMVAELLGAYFACDGSAGDGVAEFYSMSRGLLADVQHLLLRLGVNSTLRSKYAATTNYTDGPVLSWRLTLTGEALALFAALVPVHHAKATRLTQRAPSVFPSSLLPDPVATVESAGLGECRCLTVAVDHTFTANDLVVHNSLLGSQWGPLWALDYTEGCARMILWSYGKALAVENAVGIRDRLAMHLDDLHPGTRLAAGRKRMDRFRTVAGGGVVAAGVGGAVRGFGAGHGGGIIADDPFKDWQEAHSENRRNLVWNQYRGTMLDRMDDEAAWIIHVHHRVHTDDMTGRILEDQATRDVDEWDLTVLPALAPDDPAEAAHDPLGRAPGESIDPDRFSVGFYVAQRARMGSYLSAALIDQAPGAEEGTDLKRAWFDLAEQLPLHYDATCISWDLKLKDNQEGDYVVGQAWWRTGPDYWLTEQLRGRWDHATTASAIALLAVRHPECTTHLIESAGAYSDVAPKLRRGQEGYTVSDDMAGALGMDETERDAVTALRRRGMTGIIGVPATEGSKQVRARLFIAPAAEAGNVHLPAYADWVPHYLDEVAAFPLGAHDDQVDATSQALQRLGAAAPMTLTVATQPVPVPRPGAHRNAAPGAPGGGQRPTGATISLPSRRHGLPGPRR